MLKAAGPGDQFMRTDLQHRRGFIDVLGTELVEGRSFTHDEVQSDALRIARCSARTVHPVRPVRTAVLSSTRRRTW